MRIVFSLPDGAEMVAEAQPGKSVMRVAVDHNVPGIYGDCGGQCACATCHVYISPAWIDRVGTVEEGAVEHTMLEGAPADVQPNSRLACQVTLEVGLDGLVVFVPEGQ